MSKDAKGHGSNSRGITKVTGIRYSTEPGMSRRFVSVTHNRGTTSGYEDNLHMGALITRGLSEGATVSGGEPASGHQIDAAARSLASGPKSAPVPVHDSMGSSRDTDPFGRPRSADSKAEYDEYNRDLALRSRNGQVGSGMKFR